MQRVVIIGGGHAGAEAVAALRQKGWQDDIVLISAEDQLPYHRPPLSKGLLSGKTSADSLAIKKATFYAKAETELRLGTRVTGIDRTARMLTLDTGDTLEYTHLIYATGTRARRLEVPGADLPVVFYLRTLADVEAMKPRFQPGKRLLIVGAGYIGLEVAASAVTLGMSVTVLEVQDRVLARVTSPEMSDFFQRLHTDAGVTIRTDTGVTGFRTEGDHHVATLPSGEALPFDCAVVGIGVLPNIELAEQAGLACDNGVVVDEFTTTSDPAIRAIGDCCNHPDRFYQRRLRLESVPNATDQAKTAAASICGKPQPYDTLPWFWSDQYDVKLQSVGLSDGYDTLRVMGDPDSRRFFILYFRDQRLICVDAVNMPKAFMKAKTVIRDEATNHQADVIDSFGALLD